MVVVGGGGWWWVVLVVVTALKRGQGAVKTSAGELSEAFPPSFVSNGPRETENQTKIYFIFVTVTSC